MAVNPSGANAYTMDMPGVKKSLAQTKTKAPPAPQKVGGFEIVSDGPSTPAAATPSMADFKKAEKETENKVAPPKKVEKEMTREQLIDGAINAPFKVDSLNLLQQGTQETMQETQRARNKDVEN